MIYKLAWVKTTIVNGYDEKINFKKRQANAYKKTLYCKSNKTQLSFDRVKKGIHKANILFWTSKT